MKLHLACEEASVKSRVGGNSPSLSSVCVTDSFYLLSGSK